MRRGIYVGSFDPVHKGHIALVNYLILNNYVDMVEIIPTGNYWDKLDLIDVKYRIEMLRYYQDKNIQINDKLNSLKYTYMIMRELSNKYKSDKLYLIIGADNILSFDKWMNVSELFNYEIIVVPRDNIDIDKYIYKFDKREKFIIVNGFNEMDISSKMIRKFISNRERDKLDKYLDRDIINYIFRYDLYNGG